jgi:hypothetical protein
VLIARATDSRVPASILSAIMIAPFIAPLPKTQQPA